MNHVFFFFAGVGIVVVWLVVIRLIMLVYRYVRSAPQRREAKREQSRAAIRRSLGISGWKCECGMYLRFAERTGEYRVFRCPNGCTSSCAIENDRGTISYCMSAGGGP